jgi:hypothetical protein
VVALYCLFDLSPFRNVNEDRLSQVPFNQALEATHLIYQSMSSSPDGITIGAFNEVLDMLNLSSLKTEELDGVELSSIPLFTQYVIPSVY